MSDRLAILRMTPEIAVSMMKGFAGSGPRSYSVEENGVPEDAKHVRSFMSDGIIHVVIESSEFDEVPEGEEMPLLPSPVLHTERLSDEVGNE